MPVIRTATAADAFQISEIYKHYAETSIVTFGEKPLTPEAFAAQIADYSVRYSYWVAEDNGVILGYANAHEFRAFSACRQTAEVAIFLRHDRLGGGVGTALYGALLADLKKRGFHVAVAVLTVPNLQSEQLQKRFGFVQCGTLREVGLKFGTYIDACFWQKILD